MKSFFDTTSSQSNSHTLTFTIKKIQDYQAVIKKLNTKNITHIHLTGELGSGKTTFVQQWADSLLTKKYTLDSPTYTYLNTYEDTLLHIDMRRIEDKAMLHELGLLEVIEQYPYIAIERPKWTDLYIQPEKTATIHLKKTNNDIRVCTLMMI